MFLKDIPSRSQLSSSNLDHQTFLRQITIAWFSNGSLRWSPEEIDAPPAPDLAHVLRPLPTPQPPPTHTARGSRNLYNFQNISGETKRVCQHVFNGLKEQEKETVLFSFWGTGAGVLRAGKNLTWCKTPFSTMERALRRLYWLAKIWRGKKKKLYLKVHISHTLKQIEWGPRDVSEGKVTTSKPDVLSLIPESQMLKGKKPPLANCPLTSVCTHMPSHAYIHAYSDK